MTSMARVMDGVRAITATTALGVAGWVGGGVRLPLALQQPSPLPGGTEPLAEYAIRQGGALAIVVLVLFFYRRDYKGLTDYWKDQSKTLLELVAQNTKALAEMSNALSANTIVVHQAKNVMQNYLPQRRILDGISGGPGGDGGGGGAGS